MPIATAIPPTIAPVSIRLSSRIFTVGTTATLQTDNDSADRPRSSQEGMRPGPPKASPGNHERDLCMAGVSVGAVERPPACGALCARTQTNEPPSGDALHDGNTHRREKREHALDRHCPLAP